MARSDMDQLQAEIGRLREVLKQYADHSNWWGACDDYECRQSENNTWQGTDGHGWELAESVLKENG